MGINWLLFDRRWENLLLNSFICYVFAINLMEIK